MGSIVVKPNKDPHVHRPEPTLTPHEIINRVDAVNMLNLVNNLTKYMPSPYKAQLQKDGCFSVKLGKYRVQVTLCDRFEMSTGEYGRSGL